MLRLQVIVNCVMRAMRMFLPLLKSTIVKGDVLVAAAQQILNNGASPARRFTVHDYLALYLVRLYNTILFLEIVTAHVKWLGYVLCGNVNRQRNRAAIFTFIGLTNIYYIYLRAITSLFDAYNLLNLFCIERMIKL